MIRTDLISNYEFVSINKLLEEFYNPELSSATRLINLLKDIYSLVYYDRSSVMFFFKNTNGDYVKHSSLKVNWEDPKVPVSEYDNYYIKYDDTLKIFDQEAYIVFRSSGFFDESIRSSNPYWTDYLIPNGCKYSIEGNLKLKSNNGLIGSFSFFRGPDKQDFNEKDEAIISFLQPHISNVLKYYGNDIDSTSMMFSLENYNCVASAVIDKNFEIVEKSESFQKMVDNGSLSQNMLYEMKNICARLYKKNMWDNIFEYKFDDAPIFIEISKAYDKADLNEVRFNCLVYNLSYFFDKTLDHTKSKYMLTEREYEIVRELLRGKSNEEIAKECYLSVTTVKKHLASVYSKMEIKSQKQILERLHLQK